MADHSHHFSFEEASLDINSFANTPQYSEISGSQNINLIDTERMNVIWGTTININEFKNSIKTILRSYFSDEIEKIYATENYILDFDCDKIKHSPIYEQIYLYPADSIPIIAKATEEFLLEKYPSVAENFISRMDQFKIFVHISNLGKNIKIRHINPNDIDKLVSLSGSVLRISSRLPDLQKAVFSCINCEKTIAVYNIKGIIEEPVKCTCGASFSYLSNLNSSHFIDKQIIRIQELSENTPSGNTPLTISCILTNDLIDLVTPGDIIKLSGILRAVPIEVNPINKMIKPTFHTFIEVNSVHVSGIQKIEEVPFEQFIVNSNLIENNFYSELSKMIAPSVYGLDDTKKILLLQLVGGVRREFDNTSFRGDIHILLAGDPGIAKSQLLSFINKISDRGSYTSGRGSSSVGLTAAVVRDSDTGQFILEPGALVLSDSGICAIDEFDKMKDSTKAVLHEAMEQQTVSVAKAGIVTSLNARCSILASCNPIESRWNCRKSIVENINLPPTLLSRFDIINILIDKSDSANDRNVANHIINLYSHKQNDDFNINILKRVIFEAKKLQPKMSKSAEDFLIKSYKELRSLNMGRTITATTRQLESMIRLSEAHSRLRFSEYIEIADAVEAVRLIKASLLLYALDPETGQIDIDMVLTGRTTAMRESIERIKQMIIDLAKTRMTIKEMKERIITANITEHNFIGALKELEMEEKIILKEDGTVEYIFN